MKLRTFSFAVAIISAVLGAIIPWPAYAGKSPTSLLTDQRVKQVAYDPNQVYEIVGTYGYQTSIEFSNDETIKVVTLGDSIAWQTVPYQNRLFLKPVEPNAETNLTVITDKRSYYFKLVSAKKQASQTFLVRFVYPNLRPAKPVKVGPAIADARGSVNPAKLNMDYETAGDIAAIPLKRAFDDGQFTYFQFNGSASIPSVYTVGSDGTESIVNTRREGAYLVVERTAGRFTMRDGSAHLCVRNNADLKKRVVATTRPNEGN
jgi:type IV secretion system protein VirB9